MWLMVDLDSIVLRVLVAELVEYFSLIVFDGVDFSGAGRGKAEQTSAERSRARHVERYLEDIKTISKVPFTELIFSRYKRSQ